MAGGDVAEGVVPNVVCPFGYAQGALVAHNERQMVGGDDVLDDPTHDLTVILDAGLGDGLERLADIVAQGMEHRVPSVSRSFLAAALPERDGRPIF